MYKESEVKTKCKNPDCNRQAARNRNLDKPRPHGLCQMHRNEAKGLFCRVDGCTGIASSSSALLCNKHRQQIDLHGEIIGDPRRNGLRSDNTSGHVGVYAKGMKWVTQRNCKYIGTFDKLEDAVAAYNEAG